MFAANTLAQKEESYSDKKNEPRLFFSAGTQAGFWTLIDGRDIPWSVDADYSIPNEDALIGIGYSRDYYKGYNSLSDLRENFRLRFGTQEYSKNKESVFYIGWAVGISIWKNTEYKEYRPQAIVLKAPTAQVILGWKWLITDIFYLNSEACLGPPYALRVGLGVSL